MSKKIELIHIKPWERDQYPDFKSKTELKKQKLMPGYHVKPRANVEWKKYEDYYLYDRNKTVPYHESQREKKRKRMEKKKRDEARTCKGCGTKFHSYLLRHKGVPFRQAERLCADCYFKTFQKYKKGIVYDLETTGVNPWKDEPLSMCIMDLQGKVIFEHYFRPEHTKSWPDAAAIHGITPEKVANESPMSFYRDQIQKIFDASDILITYNGINFDDSFLEAAGIKLPEVMQFDVMREYAWLIHDWDEYHQGWRWWRLIDCAAYYGYEFSAHDAAEDVKATLYCYKKMVFGEN